MVKRERFVHGIGWKMCIIAVLLLCAVSFAHRAEAAFEIALSEGLNMISLPEQQENTAIGIVTGSIGGKFAYICTYKDGAWSFYDPARPGFSDLTSMDAGQAYYIYMNVSGTLVGAGLNPGSSIPLSSGWNFIGYNAAAAKAVSDALASTDGHVEQVWSLINGQWQSYVSGSSGSGGVTSASLSSLEPKRGYWVKTDGACTLSLDLDIPATTRTAPTNSTSVITSVTDDKITFEGNSTFLDNLSVGVILAAEPCAAAPQGFLRKITAISRTSNGAILTTVTASLLEAIENGTVGITRQLTYNDIDFANSTFGPGVQVYAADDNSWLITIALTIDDNDGDTVTLTGQIKITPDFLINLEVENWQLKEFRCVFSVNEHAYLSAQAVSEIWNLPRKEVEIPNTEVVMHPITVWVGWVPVVFVPKIKFMVGAGGKIEARVSGEIRQTASASAGLLYSTSTWSSIKRFQNTFEIDSAASVNFNFKAWAGPKLNVLIYGAIGPFVQISGFGDFIASVSAEEVSWDAGIYVGAEFSCGFKAHDVFGFDEDPYTYGPIELTRLRVFPTDEAGTGSVSGIVTDSALRSLPDVRAEAIKNNNVIQTVTTNDSGAYSLEQLPPQVDYQIKLSKLGYDSVTKDGIDVQLGRNTPVSTVTLHREDVGTGDVSGNVIDAFTGRGVPNVEIWFRQGEDNKTGWIYKTVTTESNGSYLISDVDPGYYTGEMRATGYAVGFFTAVCLGGGQTNPNQNGSITPLVDDREMAIVLTWHENPRDLDSHLTGPIEGSSSRFHVAYYSRGSSTSSPFALLDHDDVTSYGPETITIYRQFDGVYRYSVHLYSGSGSLTTTSGAYVAVYRGNDLWWEFNVPSTGTGRVWTVFEMNGTEIREIGTIGNTITSVNKEDDNIIENLPPK